MCFIYHFRSARHHIHQDTCIQSCQACYNKFHCSHKDLSYIHQYLKWVIEVNKVEKVHHVTANSDLWLIPFLFATIKLPLLIITKGYCFIDTLYLDHNVPPRIHWHKNTCILRSCLYRWRHFCTDLMKNTRRCLKQYIKAFTLCLLRLFILGMEKKIRWSIVTSWRVDCAS